MRSVCLLSCLTYYSGTWETYISFFLFGLSFLILVSPLFCAVPAVLSPKAQQHIHPWSSQGRGEVPGWRSREVVMVEAAGGSLKTAAESRMELGGRRAVVFQTRRCWNFGTGFLKLLLAFRGCQKLTEGEKISISAWTGAITCWESQASERNGKWEEMTVLSG